MLVLTSRPDPAYASPGVTFVNGGIAAAVVAAREAAAGRDVVVFGPSLATECLDAGLLDEIVVTVAPVLLGDGIRFHGGPVERHLEPVGISPTGHFVNLTYRVA